MSGVRLLANGMVGLGFSYRGFQAGLALEPDMIGCDAGTADTGPGPLGSGLPPKGKLAVACDLRIMLRGARELGVPLVIGSCGGAGADPHLEATRDILVEIAREDGHHLRLALVHAEQDRRAVVTALREGRIRPLGPVPELTVEAVEASSHIVGMMGAQPLIDALDAGADVVLAGRATDPAIFASAALRHGVAPGPAWHAAKSIDKGALATEAPMEGSPVLATVDDDGFVVEPTKVGARCTVASVAGITMHENPDPWSIYQPSGAITSRHATYEQLDERRVRVTGSEFMPAATPSIKLEGARLVGHRAIMIAGVRDPRLLARLDDFLAAYRALLEKVFASLGVAEGDYRLLLRVYGRDGVMGRFEPQPDVLGKEVCLIVDVVADDPELAYTLASRAGSTGTRFDFTGRLGNGANFAYPFSLPVIRVGPVYEWSVWHLLDTPDEAAPFELELVEL